MCVLPTTADCLTSLEICYLWVSLTGSNLPSGSRLSHGRHYLFIWKVFQWFYVATPEALYIFGTGNNSQRLHDFFYFSRLLHRQPYLFIWRGFQLLDTVTPEALFLFGTGKDWYVVVLNLTCFCEGKESWWKWCHLLSFLLTLLSYELFPFLLSFSNSSQYACCHKEEKLISQL